MSRPLRAGGFCDVFEGELTEEQATAFAKPVRVAMKLLRLFNTELDDHLIKAKAVCVTASLCINSVELSIFFKTFRREVDIWRSLQHRHVLPFLGTFELDESRLFMVSPWADGGNSLQYLRQHPDADRGRLVRIF